MYRCIASLVPRLHPHLVKFNYAHASARHTLHHINRLKIAMVDIHNHTIASFMQTGHAGCVYSEFILDALTLVLIIIEQKMIFSIQMILPSMNINLVNDNDNDNYGYSHCQLSTIV